MLAIMLTITVAAADSLDLSKNLTLEQQELLDTLDEPHRILAVAVLSGQAVRETEYDEVPLNTPFRMRGSTQNGAWEVSQVINEREFLAAGFRIWMAYPDSFTTKNLADGKSVKVRGQLAVLTGNKTYDTLVGTRTVRVVQVLDVDQCADVVDAIAKPHGFRLWGRGTPNVVLGRYDQWRGSQALITLLNGKTVRITRSRMTEADQKYVDEQRKNR